MTNQCSTKLRSLRFYVNTIGIEVLNRKIEIQKGKIIKLSH